MKKLVYNLLYEGSAFDEKNTFRGQMCKGCVQTRRKDHADIGNEGRKAGGQPQTAASVQQRKLQELENWKLYKLLWNYS